MGRLLSTSCSSHKEARSLTKRLDSVVTDGVTTIYHYDGNGNITQKGGQTYAFDLGNRLGGSNAYDGHGRRTKITSSDATTIQVYSQGGQLLWSEKNSDGTFPATATYVCSVGTVVGSQCVTTYPATGMACNPGDSLSGSICTHTSAYAASATYNCPNGGSLSGSTCSRNDNYAASVTYICNTGDTRSNSTCTHINYVPASVTYSCPSGYTLRYTSCTTDAYVAATAGYNCNGSGALNASGLCVGAGTLAYSYYEAYDACLAQADSYGLSLDSVTLVSGKRYDCTFQANTTYSCPNGGALNSTQCVSIISQPAIPTYDCSVGTPTGTQCAVPQTYAATANYSCPNGGTPSGSTCLKTAVYTATAVYNCPSGGSLSGSSCMLTSTYPATTANGTCNPGDTLSGSICTHSSANAAAPSYSCPNGGTLTGDQCVGANSTRTAYIYLGGKQIAETVVDGVTQYAHTDALGSPVAHTNQAGAVLNRTKYEPYGFTAAGTKPGREIPGLTTTGSAIGFTGHVNDPDTDLVYMQQRYYDPIAGRFLSVDPVTTDENNGGSFNRYTYAANNPYKNVDPDGRNPVLAARLVYAAAFRAATALGAPALGSAIATVIWNVAHSDDTPGPAVGTGCIYCVPGDRTKSGKDYIGSSDDYERRQKESKKDGRERKPEDVVDNYDTKDKQERKKKEQQWINDKGGKGELDNKRDEIKSPDWEEKGVKPPPPKEPAS